MFPCGVDRYCPTCHVTYCIQVQTTTRARPGKGICKTRKRTDTRKDEGKEKGKGHGRGQDRTEGTASAGQGVQKARMRATHTVAAQDTHTELQSSRSQSVSPSPSVSPSRGGIGIEPSLCSPASDARRRQRSNAVIHLRRRDVQGCFTSRTIDSVRLQGGARPTRCQRAQRFPDGEVGTMPLRRREKGGRAGQIRNA